MGENSPISENINSAPVNSNRQGQRGRILKIGFLIVGALMLFGILIYSNFLHKTVKQANVMPSPANYAPEIFKYDVGKAKTILTKYIRDNIKTESLPAEFNIEQGLSTDGRKEVRKDQFGSRFTNTETSDLFSINFHFKQNTDTPNDFIIFIQPNNQKEATATAKLANSLVSNYFSKPYSPITKCQAKGKIS